MNITLNNNLGKTVEYAKQAVVRYIHDAQLGDNDRIPGKDILSRALDLSGTTVMRAISALTEDGVLETRNRVGTYIRPGGLAGTLGRSIGVTAPLRTAPSYYHCSMATHVQNALVLHGCMPVTFLRRGVNWRGTSHVEDFPGLEYAIRHDKLDGIIDLCDFDIDPGDAKQAGLPYVLLTISSEERRRGIAPDIDGFMATAMRRAAALGKRRPAITVSVGRYAAEVLCRDFPRLVDECGFDPAAKAFVFAAASQIEGRYWARALLDLAPEKRPDVLIFVDEVIGEDLLNALNYFQGGSGDYRPLVITHDVREMPTLLLWDEVICYRLSLTEMADMAVSQLLDIARGVGKAGGFTAVPYREVEVTAFPNDANDFAVGRQRWLEGDGRIEKVW